MDTNNDSETWDVPLEDVATDDILDDADIRESGDSASDTAIEDSVDFEPMDVECRVLDYDSIDLGNLAFEVYTPIRPPTSCGDNCRQISIVQDDIGFGYDVDGEYVVFTTQRTESAELVDSRLNIVRLRDLSHMYITREQVNAVIGDTPGWGNLFRRAEVSESKVVFFRENTIGTDYYKSDMLVYDLESRHLELARSNIFYFTIASPIPRLERNLVALFENATSDTLGAQIVTFDLESREECVVSISGCCVTSHRIHEGRVAFIERIISQEVYLYDSAVKQTTQLTRGTWDRIGTRIWGDKIIWNDMREGGTSWSLEYADLYMFDVSTGVESPLITHEASQVSSDIWVDRFPRACPGSLPSQTRGLTYDSQRRSARCESQDGSFNHGSTHGVLSSTA